MAALARNIAGGLFSLSEDDNWDGQEDDWTDDEWGDEEGWGEDEDV